MSQDKLEHYGIPGMKWGVRKYNEYKGRRDKARADRAAKKEAKIQSILKDARRFESKESYDKIERMLRASQQPMSGKDKLKLTGMAILFGGLIVANHKMKKK